MARVWHIYVLKSPEGAVRYVGKTHSKPDTRLSEHLSKARTGGVKTHTATWLRSLLKDGLIPTLEVIETGSHDNWADREIFWITHYKSTGCDLTNHTSGGEGTLGWNPTADQRAKMGANAVKVHTGKKRSKASKQRMSASQIAAAAARKEAGKVVTRPPISEETRERMAQAQRGKRASKELKSKLSAAHSNPSKTTRGKLSAAVLKRPKQEREKFAKNRLGTHQTPEHRAKIAEARKLWWAKKRGEVDTSQG